MFTPTFLNSSPLFYLKNTDFLREIRLSATVFIIFEDNKQSKSFLNLIIRTRSGKEEKIMTKVVEILGDSVREDLNFVSSKIEVLPTGKTVYFVSENLRDIKLLKQAPLLSRIEIDVKNESRYKIIFPKNLKLYFILSKNLEKFKDIDYLFLINLEKFEKVKKKAREKVFLLTARGEEPKKIAEIREELGEKLEIIQLGLPESWLEL